MDKSELMNELRAENQQYEEFLDQIGPARMEIPGVAGYWSVKDIVAHLYTWRRRTVARLQAAQRGQPEPPPPWPASLEDDDEINAWIYETNHARPVREILDESHQVFQQFLAAIEGLPDKILQDPMRHLPWLGGVPFSAAQFFAHYHEEHEPDMRAWLARQEQLQRSDHQPQGFLAVPPSGDGQGVLVLHAWWGLNDTIKAFCTRLAASGFVAFAPDLYHGKLADNIAGAEALARALDANALQAMTEIIDASLYLNQRVGADGRALAVIGFSLGANYALKLAATDPDHIRSVVLFYGTGGGDFSSSRAAYLGHFAEKDEFEPLSNVDELEAALRSAGRPVTFYRYQDTGHWFFEPDRPQAYNPVAASLAWDRTLAFLKRSPAS